MFVLGCNPHGAKDVKTESRVKMEKSSNPLIVNKKLLESQISATFIFPDPASSFAPLQTNINPSDKNVLVFNELKTPITKNTKQINNSKSTTTLSTAIEDTKIKIKYPIKVLKTTEFASSADSGKEELISDNNLDLHGQSLKESNQRQPLHLQGESRSKEDEENNSKKECREQKSSSKMKTSPTHNDCEMSSGSIYNVRISATTVGSQKRKSKSKSQTTLPIPNSIFIEKSKNRKAMSRSSIDLCPSCSKTPLIYQERKLDDENNSILKVPPFCSSCKAYIVSESSHERDRQEQLANLTEWMIDSELDLDSDSDMKERPREGTILVMLDNKSTTGNNKESNPPVSRWTEEDHTIENHSQLEARDPENDNRKSVDEVTNILENQSQLEAKGPNNYDREVVKEDGKNNKNQAQLETRNPDDDMREKLEEVDGNILGSERMDCGGSFTSPIDNSTNNSVIIHNGHSISDDEQEVYRNGKFSINRNDNPTSDDQYSCLKLNTRQHTSVVERDYEHQLRLVNTDEEEELIMADYNQKRDMVTKVIGNKLMKGYSLSQVQCETCEMPIMERNGLFHCVACPYIKKKAKKNACLKRLKVREMTSASGKDLKFLEQLRDQSQTPRISNRNSKQEFTDNLQSPSWLNTELKSSQISDFNALEHTTSDDKIDDILESEAQKVLDLMVPKEPMVLIYDTIAEEGDTSSNEDNEILPEGLGQHEMKEEVNIPYNLKRHRDEEMIDELLNEFDEKYEEEKKNEPGILSLHKNCRDLNPNISFGVSFGCCTYTKEIIDHHRHNIPEQELSWAQENKLLCSIEEGVREDSWSDNFANSYPLHYNDDQKIDNDFPERLEKTINEKRKKSALLQILSNEPDSTYIYVEESSSEESDAQPKQAPPKYAQPKYAQPKYVQQKYTQPKKVQEESETCKKIHPIKNRDWNSENFSNHIFDKLKDGWILTPFRCPSCVALQMKSIHGEPSCIFCSPCDLERQTETEFDDQVRSTNNFKNRNQSAEKARINQDRKTPLNPSVQETVSEIHNRPLDESNHFVDEVQESASNASSTEKTELTSSSSFMTQETQQESNQKELQHDNSLGKKYQTGSKIDEVWKELLAFEKEISEKHLLPSTSFGSEENFDIITTNPTDELITGSLTQSIHELSEERNLFDKTISTFERLGREEMNEMQQMHPKIDKKDGVAHGDGLSSTINDIIERQKEIDKQFIDIIPNALNFCLSPINQCTNPDNNEVCPIHTNSKNRSISLHKNKVSRNISVLDQEDDMIIDTMETKNDRGGHEETKHITKVSMSGSQMIPRPSKSVFREGHIDGKENIFSQNSVNRTLQKWQEYENGRLKTKIKDNGKTNPSPEDDSCEKECVPNDSTKELRKSSLGAQETLKNSKIDPSSSQKNPESAKKNTESVNIESLTEKNQSNCRKSLLKDDDDADDDDINSSDDSWFNYIDRPKSNHTVLMSCDPKNSQTRPKTKPIPEGTRNPRQKIEDDHIHQTNSLDDKIAENYVLTPDSSFDAKLLYDDDDDDYSNTFDDEDDDASLHNLEQDSDFIDDDDNNNNSNSSSSSSSSSKMRNSPLHPTFAPNSTKKTSTTSPMSTEKSSQSESVIVNDEYNIEAQIEMALLLQQLASAASARKSKNERYDSSSKSHDESLAYLKHGLF